MRSWWQWKHSDALQVGVGVAALLTHTGQEVIDLYIYKNDDDSGDDSNDDSDDDSDDDSLLFSTRCSMQWSCPDM